LAFNVLNVLALIEGFEADAGRSLRAAEGNRSLSEQLLIDAYSDGGNGAIVTPFGIVPVEALVGKSPVY
jgi:hypothetical protein